MKHNIIFLDIDGVLNTLYSSITPSILFDPTTISNLKLILNMTQSKIVLSTAWRLYPKYKKMLFDEFEKHDLKDIIIGETPDLSIFKKSRDFEILSWVKCNKNIIKKWVAIDDLNLDKLHSQNFVRTNFFNGLTNKKTGEVISKLIFD